MASRPQEEPDETYECYLGDGKVFPKLHCNNFHCRRKHNAVVTVLTLLTGYLADGNVL